MLVIDEYVAIRVLGGDWPDALPDDDLVLPASQHWRLFQRILMLPAGVTFGNERNVGQTLARVADDRCARS